jgi:hypothetical protein
VEGHGAEAAELGWHALTLFSVHPSFGTRRGDWCGRPMPCTCPMHEMTERYLKMHLQDAVSGCDGTEVRAGRTASSRVRHGTTEDAHENSVLPDCPIL